MTPEQIQSLILYRDGLILVLNKPSGIPVHAGTGKLIPLDRDFDHLRFGLPKPPALAHRLDKDTSGCLVLGRNNEALKRLGKLFAQDRIQKTYMAIVHGRPEMDEGTIDLPLGPQSTRKDLWWMKVDYENGKPAITHYKVIKTTDTHSLLELMPQTGRTHQLRVHCQAMGCPIVGDKIYGTGKDESSLCLHAASIEIPLYPKREAISVHAPLPDHMMHF